MGKLTGLVMIFAGVGAAAYVYPLIGSGSDKAEKQLVDVVAISTAGTASQTVTSPPPRVISAQPAPGRPALSAQALPSPQPSSPALSTPPPSSTGTAVTGTAVTPTPAPLSPQVTAKVIDVPIPQPARRAKAEDEGKAILARDIQRELKRVGCYGGDADGTWNTSTKQAMKTFIDRVNATLPTDEPDHILKTLVQGHPGNACGKSCPTGQTATADSRCLPTAVMAQAPVKRSASVESAAVPQKPAATETAAGPAAAQPKAASAWETTTTVVAPPTMAAIAAAGAVKSAETVDRMSTQSAPLPGRMAIGASTPVEPAQPAPKAVVVKAKPRPQPEDKSEPTEKVEKVDKPDKPSRPPVAAVAAAETSTPRRSTPAPAPRVAAYRPPPPRYVGVYTPPARERPRFGPSIFRQMEMSGR